MDIVQDEDLYKVLGVSPEAEDPEIRKAYKKLAIALHPDKYVDKPPQERSEAEQAFAKVSYAYNVLKDQEQRNEYDFMRRMKAGSVPAEEFAPPDAAALAEISAERKERAEKRFRQGMALQMEKNTKGALEAFKEAVKMNPNVTQYHTMLAVTYQKMGWTSYAMTEVQEALKIEPKEPLAIKIRAQLREVEKAAEEKARMAEEKDNKGKKKKQKKGEAELPTKSKKKVVKPAQQVSFKKKKKSGSLLETLLGFLKR